MADWAATPESSSLKLFGNREEREFIIGVQLIVSPALTLDRVLHQVEQAERRTTLHHVIGCVFGRAPKFDESSTLC